MSHGGRLDANYRGLFARFLAHLIDEQGDEGFMSLWRGAQLTGDEKHELLMMRHEAEVVRAGCSCGAVLLGHKPSIGPRCRLCNTQAERADMDQAPVLFG